MQSKKTEKRKGERMMKCEECGKPKKKPKKPSKPNKAKIREMALKKVKRLIRELESERLNLYESMGKLIIGDFKYDISNYKDNVWCSHVEIESADFSETFFIDKETGENKYKSDE